MALSEFHISVRSRLGHTAPVLQLPWDISQGLCPRMEIGVEWSNLDSSLVAGTSQQLTVSQANLEFLHLRDLRGGGQAWNDDLSKHCWFFLFALQEMFIYPGLS